MVRGDKKQRKNKMKKQVKKQVKKQAAKKQVKAAKKQVKAETKPTAEDKRAKRREYAKAYYQANREKLVAASAKSHAKRNAEARSLLKEAYDILSGLVSEIGEDALTRYGDPSILDRLATFAK